MKIKSLAEPFIQWGLGNGDIFFWQDNWLGMGSIDSMISSNTLCNSKVNHYIDNGKWNINMLYPLLPEDILNHIMKIPLNFMENDRILFKASTNGRFNIKEVWNDFITIKDTSKIYANIWHNNIPMSYSILTWRCLKGFLPVDARLWNKGFYLPSKCYCCADIESINHVFLFGKIAQKVWRFYALLVNKDIPDIYDADRVAVLSVLSDWMSSVKGNAINLLPIFILWFLWKARNAAKHDGIKMNSSFIISDIKHRLFQSFTSLSFARKNLSNCKVLCSFLGIPSYWEENFIKERVVRWLKLKAPAVKLNSDGAVNAVSAGFGGLIRDSVGTIIVAYTGPLSPCMVIFAELMGLLKGLIICHNRGFFNAEIEVDALNVIQIIKNSNSLYPQFFYTIREIRLLLSKLNFTLTHLLREGGECLC
ncbi:hypothetical protein KFK09_018979 [Dendrobium nobile]|uniref:Uncharacterized protein n=1 Tax=Dendrobium nobile TaxID=94219 RepID=A0A8T3AW95_DENNO|nr:hypothetical protein KFK09_018979 [Dendrobium nobile]